MFSVTQRIKAIKQPRLGYLPVSKFFKEQFYDDYIVNEVDVFYKSIQGMAVDYLARYMNGEPKEKAFKISLMGADEVNELNKAREWLEKINGLDDESIYAACKLSGYDVAIRRGVTAFATIDDIDPDENVLENIKIFVIRTLEFFKKYSPIVLDGFDFKGAYNGIISNGDGDFLTKDTLWELKVTDGKPDSKHTLQILTYYILGIHSIHAEFKTLKYIGIFNPVLNASYTISLSSINDEIYYNVSKKVIGYEMPKKIKDWKDAKGTNKKVINEILNKVKKEYINTGFSVWDMADGIYDITIDDYWTYYRNNIKKNSFIDDFQRPNFSEVLYVKLIKNSGFIMFASVSEKGSICILDGGTRNKITRPLEFYYEKLPEYANVVLKNFSEYWKFLSLISKLIDAVKNNNKKMLKEYFDEYDLLISDKYLISSDLNSGNQIKHNSVKNSSNSSFHGCIIDIDFFNHIFINPFDGTISPYFAKSTVMRYIYKNVQSLLVAKRPDLLHMFNRAIEYKNNSQNNNMISSQNNVLSIFNKHQISKKVIKETSTDIYKINLKMVKYQKILDHNLIVFWNEDILPQYKIHKNKRQEKSKPLKPGEKKNMECGMSAVIISDNGYKNLTIQFDDGLILGNCRRDKFIQGKIIHPSFIKEKNKRLVEKPKKEKISYIGKTQIMKCGLKATVIEDFGAKNITIQFEDGLIRKNCRRDKFKEGRIAYRK